MTLVTLLDTDRLIAAHYLWLSLLRLFLFYLTAAARALIHIPELSAEDVARKAMDVASDMCVFTNKEFMIEVMDTKEEEGGEESAGQGDKKE